MSKKLYLQIKEYSYVSPWCSITTFENLSRDESMRYFEWDYDKLKSALKEVELKIVEKQND